MAANVIFCRAKFCRLLFSRSSVTHLSPLSSQTAVGGVQTPFPGAASAFPYGTMPYASNFFGGAQGTETAVGDADANNANGEQKPGARKSRGGTNSSAPPGRTRVEAPTTETKQPGIRATIPVTQTSRVRRARLTSGRLNRGERKTQGRGETAF